MAMIAENARSKMNFLIDGALPYCASVELQRTRAAIASFLRKPVSEIAR